MSKSVSIKRMPYTDSKWSAVFCSLPIQRSGTQFLWNCNIVLDLDIRGVLCLCRPLITLLSSASVSYCFLVVVWRLHCPVQSVCV